MHCSHTSSVRKTIPRYSTCSLLTVIHTWYLNLTPSWMSVQTRVGVMHKYEGWISVATSSCSHHEWYWVKFHHSTFISRGTYVQIIWNIWNSTILNFALSSVMLRFDHTNYNPETLTPSLLAMFISTQVSTPPFSEVTVFICATVTMFRELEDRLTLLLMYL